ncbi:hypothetical protein E2C01_100669 [Portunus trituberculatus]|uniref:Uncharacterized protein n=1 Tax=Portunus trituberculatus TaxID=210409 RepID=A0A5B7KK07_PORTR|nr:hypothetical protein [Portunus trituberculatus]
MTPTTVSLHLPRRNCRSGPWKVVSIAQDLDPASHQLCPVQVLPSREG